MKKKVNIFGKAIPVFAIFILGMALVSAALITSWGTITGLVTVSQGFSLDGTDWNADTITETSVTMTSLEEKTVTSGAHYLENLAEVNAEFSLTTDCTYQEDVEGPVGCDEDVSPTIEYILDTEGNAGAGNEDTIYIRASDVGITTLSQLESMSWEIYTVNGYPAHVDIILGDIDGNTGTVDRITAEMAVNHNMAILDIDSGLPAEWLKTFEFASNDDAFETIGDGTIFWVTALGAGTADAPYGTLAQLKAGDTLANPGNDVLPTINGTTEVIGFEIEVDNWVADTNARIRNIEINTQEPEVSGLANGDTLNFQIVTDFPKMLIPGKYTITTTVEPTA